MGRQKLFFHTADWQHLAAQSDFTGHGQIATDRNAGERADDGSAKSDSGRRAVLGDGAFWYVDVNVHIAIKVMREAQASGARSDVTHGGLRGLLHYVA